MKVAGMTYKVKPVKLRLVDLEELACELLDLEYDEVDLIQIEDALLEKFGVPMDGFAKLICHLVPMTMVANNGPDSTTFHGFSSPMSETGKLGCWLVKVPKEEIQVVQVS